MLPQRPAPRRGVYERILDAGAELHGALENLSVCSLDDVARLEDVFMVDRFAATSSMPG